MSNFHLNILYDITLKQIKYKQFLNLFLKVKYLILEGFSPALFMLMSVFPAGGGAPRQHRGAFAPAGGPAGGEEPRAGQGEDWVGVKTPKEKSDVECVIE